MSDWGLGADFSEAACHVEGCLRPVQTHWSSCYADTILCAEHETIFEDEVFFDEDADFSCCWYPQSWVHEQAALVH